MVWACDIGGRYADYLADEVWLHRVAGWKIGENRGHFYGMELPRVGAFTENRGSGYRNPVQILA